MPAFVEVFGGDDEEAVSEVELIAVAAEPAQGRGPMAAAGAAQDGGGDEEAGADGEDGAVERGAAEEAHPVPAGPKEDPEDEGAAEELEGEKWCAARWAAFEEAVGKQGAEAAEGDGVHAAEVGFVSPDRIAGVEDGAGVGANGDERDQHREEERAGEFVAEEQKAEQGEGEVEGFLDG